MERKIRSVEKQSIFAEFGTAAFVVTASMVLKLGIAMRTNVGGMNEILNHPIQQPYNL